MNIRAADLIVYTLLSGDATSDHTIAIARLLREIGVCVRILSHLPLGPLPDDIRPMARQTHYANYTSAADLTVLQYPIWYPLAERFREAPGARVFWYHGVTPPEYAQASHRYALQNAQIRTELAWHAHLAAVASPYMAKELAQHAGYPLDRIRVVPIGVDVAAFRRPPPEPMLRKLRKQWNLLDKKIMLYVGRIAPHKGIDLLLEALASLHGDYPDLHLLIVGDTKQGTGAQQLAQRLQARAANLQITANVTFTGRVDRIAPYMHLADLLVLPSRHEGFGIPLVEAMAAGAPVVAGAGGAMPWVLGAEEGANGGAGNIFPPDRTDLLAEAVRQLLEDGDRRRLLIARGRERAAKFDRRHFAQLCTNLLAEAVEVARVGLPPAAQQPIHTLYAQADIARRSYQIRSRVPILGSVIAKLRHVSTSHLKDAYLDPTIEHQINYNRKLASGIGQLEAELRKLDALFDRNENP